MNDFQAGPGNLNNDSNNNLPHLKKPNTILDLLMGLAISAAAYILIWFVSTGMFPVIVIALVDFAVLAAFGFLIVKFFRTSHIAAAIIMLVLISPCILALLLWGACSVMFSQF